MLSEMNNLLLHLASFTVRPYGLVVGSVLLTDLRTHPLTLGASYATIVTTIVRCGPQA